MYPGRKPVSRPDESVIHDVNERRLPTPVNHLNTFRPVLSVPPSSWTRQPTIFCPEVSSGPKSLPASHGHLNHAQPPASGLSTSGALSTGISHTWGSAESTPVSASQQNLNPSQPRASGLHAPWALGMPFACGSVRAVPQYTLSSRSNSGQPWTPAASTPWALPTEATEAPRVHAGSESVSQPAFDYSHHTLSQPNRMSQTPRALGQRVQKSSSPARASRRQNSLTSSSNTSPYISRFHDVSMDEHFPSHVDRAYRDGGTHDRVTFRARSSSPNMQLNVILEDPQSGQLYREKRVRTREELDSQKEGMRVLKDNGGACTACYKSKKRCGPGDPCPPCAARGRKCVRLNRDDGETVSTGGQPVSASTQPVPTSSQYVSTSPQFSSSPTQPNTLINPPCLPESMQPIPAEPAPNADLQSLDPEPPEDYFDPLFIDSWETGMLCIDSAYDNSGHTWVGSDGGHLTI
ncbi:hypothetical protein PEBR_04997 [Penicillium brasilianum]|uniref:Zn(2)-C6 fungal-type domain-containing protein n=1 Tax=Penicillium brasilianum TaxID=104259 RepID=A0A1S9RX42_PENBI|nr:hypothetical protein PEBR_04997 [Penicillium brasilianum]